MSNSIPERFCWPRLPLTVYREVAAHLRQVDGVEVRLLLQTSSNFDYEMSQVGGLELSSIQDLSSGAQERVLDILRYYSNTFGAWQVL